MAAGLRTASGAPAALLALEGERARVASTEAAAPGQPLALALPNGRTLRLKVYRCRRIAGATLDEPTADAALPFEIEGRLVDATRALRAVLAELLAGRTGDPAADD
ncbi:MAG: hypothetical protein IT373_03880 [Polyangiaceae bacterium]|nr:hypothetical protein [Polyangiaceae bacterium]